MFAVVRRPIICLLIIVGGVLMISTACAAQDADRFFFPLPLSLEVGDRWTYSIVKIHKAKDQILDTLSTEMLTTRVVDRLQIEDQSYFALSDGGIYRVDETSRTWQYDTEAKSEKVVWDIWGPIVWDIWPGVWQIPRIEKPVINGYACEYDCLSRYGPFVRHPIPEPRYAEIYDWIATTDADTIRYDRSIGSFVYFPYVWTYKDIIKFPDWGITELYVFEKGLYESERLKVMTLVIAPNVGVVYYTFSRYYYADVTVIKRIEKTAWILQDVQKGDPGSTVIEDISFGQLKQRMTRPAPNVP